MLIGHIVHSQN